MYHESIIGNYMYALHIVYIYIYIYTYIILMRYLLFCSFVCMFISVYSVYFFSSFDILCLFFFWYPVHLSWQLLFPSVPVTGDKFSYFRLTQNHSGRWFDKLFHTFKGIFFLRIRHPSERWHSSDEWQWMFVFPCISCIDSDLLLQSNDAGLDSSTPWQLNRSKHVQGVCS